MNTNENENPMFGWKRPTNTDFYWLIEEAIAGMAHPGTAPEAFADLVEKGVGAIVSLTEKPLPATLVRAQGMEYLHLPVTDYSAPSQSQVDSFIEFCEWNLDNERAVAVHCLAGRGRTGTMLACYLVRRGLEANEALNRVRSVRPGAVENFEQETAVYEFQCREETGQTPAHAQPEA
mgnify:CR=1 FL=1